MIPTFSSVSLLATPIMDQLAAIADAGGTAVDLWLTQVEELVGQEGTVGLLRLKEERGLRFVSACYQGGLLLSQAEERRLQFDHFQRRLSLCQELGVEVIALVPDFMEKATATDLARAQVSLKQAGQLAATYGIRLALEFRGGSRWCACLPTAVLLVAAAEEANVGICLDLFHFYTGPSKWEDLAYLSTQNLFLVQLSDVAGGLRELVSDSDRILPGEGDFRLEPLLSHLTKMAYAGPVCVEVLNPALWRMKPVQVAEAALTGLRRLLGLASMQ